MEEKKICRTCTNEFPKTENYFFKKKDSYKLADGTKKTFYKLTSDCKKCHGQKEVKRKRLKRCIELGCNEANYRETYLKKQEYDKLKYKELLGIPQSKRHYIREKIDKGYIFKGEKQWDKDVQENFKNAAINRRKYNYDNKDKLTTKEKNKMRRESITKSIVANRFQIPVKQLPDEIYQIYKAIILLKRELNFGIGINR